MKSGFNLIIQKGRISFMSFRMVTLVPRAEKMVAYSMVIIPPPIMASLLGICVSSRMDE
jgi:hypothetical protein